MDCSCVEPACDWSSRRLLGFLIKLSLTVGLQPTFRSAIFGCCCHFISVGSGLVKIAALVWSQFSSEYLLSDAAQRAHCSDYATVLTVLGLSFQMSAPGSMPVNLAVPFSLMSLSMITSSFQLQAQASFSDFH